VVAQEARVLPHDVHDAGSDDGLRGGGEGTRGGVCRGRGARPKGHPHRRGGGGRGRPPPRGPTAGPGPVRRSRPGRRPPVRGPTAGGRAGPEEPLYSAAHRGVGRPLDEAAAAVLRRRFQPPRRSPRRRSRGRSGNPSPAAMPPGVLDVGALRPPDGGGSDERWRASNTRPGGAKPRSSPPPEQDGGPSDVIRGGRRGGRGVAPPEAGMHRAWGSFSPAEHAPQGRGAGLRGLVPYRTMRMRFDFLGCVIRVGCRCDWISMTA